MRIKRPDQARFCKALFVAPGGAGKTVLMGTAQEDPRTSPMLLLDFEGGYESLAGLEIDIAEIRSWQDYNEVYEGLTGNHWEIPGSSLAEGESYKSLGIDSISETHKWTLLNILEEEGASRKDPDLIEQRDYGKATVLMRRLLREFRDLPMHIFFSAHAKEIEVAREGRVRVPDMAGQMAEEVSGLMSVVGYLAQFEEDGVNHRTLLLHSFPRYRIKARTPYGIEVPEELIDPTVTDLLDALGYGAPVNSNTTHGTGSSRGKQVEDRVPQDDSDAEPAVDPQDKPEETEPETNDDAAGKQGGLPTGGHSDDELREMKFTEIKDVVQKVAEEHGITDVPQLRNKSQAIEWILNIEAEAASVPNG